MLAIPSQTAAPAAMLSSAGFAAARVSPRFAGVCSPLPVRFRIVSWSGSRTRS